MRLQIKALTGTTLSLLLSLAAVCPAIAQPDEVPGAPASIAQMGSSESMRGKIRSIVGNVVTLEMPNGNTREVTIARSERERLGLRPGMEIMTTMRDGNLLVEVMTAGAASPTTEDTAPLGTSSTTIDGTTNAETTGRTTTRRVVEETTIRRRTTSSPAVIDQTTEQTTGDVQRSTQIVEQNNDMAVPDNTNSTYTETTQQNRPVRALW